MYRVYGKPSCPFCVRAKEELDKRDLPYEYVDVRFDRNALDLMKSIGARTVPQIFEGSEHIGGYDDLMFIIE